MLPELSRTYKFINFCVISYALYLILNLIHYQLQPEHLICLRVDYITSSTNVITKSRIYVILVHQP